MSEEAGPPFHELPVEQKIKKASVIALARYQASPDGHMRAILTEILKKGPALLSRVRGRSPKTIQILVRDGTRIHRLTQDDPGDAVPALRTIRIGDSVVAMTKPDLLGRDLERVWGLRRGNEQLLSYTETLRIILAKAERAQRVAFAFGAVAALLLCYAFALRVRLGAWCEAPENR